MYTLLAFPLPSPTTPVCNCLTLSSYTQSYGSNFTTNLTFDNYFDGRKSYFGYDPCCGDLRPIEIKYSSTSTRWEMFWDGNLQAYLTDETSCPTGTTWTNIGSTMSLFSVSAITCPTLRQYTQPNYIQSNECSVLTIHPMGAICEPSSPVDPGGYGSLSVTITGGTPPYSVTLLNSTGNVIRNIPPTNYTVPIAKPNTPNYNVPIPKPITPVYNQNYNSNIASYPNNNYNEQNSVYQNRISGYNNYQAKVNTFRKLGLNK